MALCFGVPKAIVEGWRLQFGAGFLSEFEGCNLELSFLESKVEHLQPQAETPGPLRFDVAKVSLWRRQRFGGFKAAIWSWFLQFRKAESEWQKNRTLKEKLRK